MPNELRDELETWGYRDVLAIHPDFSLKPTDSAAVRLSGRLMFAMQPSDLERIEDAFEIEMVIPSDFPNVPPSVWELGGRIPSNIHKHRDGSLCLGTPAGLKLALRQAPTLLGFVNACVVPYLYGFLYFSRHGRFPFGEAAHGVAGIRQGFAELLHLRNEKLAQEFVKLAGMRKRDANKVVCPCGSGRRLGKCHNVVVNDLRLKLGRKFLSGQYRVLNKPPLQLPPPAPLRFVGSISF